MKPKRRVPPTVRTPRALCPSLLAAAAVLAGCSDDRFAAELASELYAAPVRSPVARVVEAGPLAAAAEAREIGPERLAFSVGARDGDERYVFGRIADAAVSGSGDTVFVLDALERRVKAFTADGRFLYHFGQRGKGPGEYEDPASITWLPWNGALAVWDANLQRITLLTPAGEVLHTHLPLRQSDIARTGKKLRAYHGGFVLEVRSDVFTVAPERQRGHLVRLDTLGQVRDTVLDFAVPPIRGSTQQGAEGLVSSMQLYAPHWTPQPRWDLSADGVVAFVPGGRYELYRLPVKAPALALVRRPWTPAKLSRRERVVNLEGSRQRREISPDVPMFVMEFLHRKTFARVRPSVTGVLAAAGGAAWVRRFDVGDHDDGLSRSWDVYGPDGAAGGHLRLAEGFLPLILTTDRILGIRRDALGVDYLESYRT